jgi:hypothetical protein
MNKFNLSIFLILISIQVVKAQEEFHYNFGNKSSGSGNAYTGVQATLNAALLVPLSDGMRARISGGIGANVQLKYMFDSKFTIGAYGGYNLLAGKPAVPGQVNTLLHYGGLVEYFFFPGSSPYLGMDVGNYVFSQSLSGTSTGQSNSVSVSLSSIGIGPNLGYVVSLSPNMLLNANLKYSHVFNSIISFYQVPTQFLQLNVGLIFNLSYRPKSSDE